MGEAKLIHRDLDPETKVHIRNVSTEAADIVKSGISRNFCSHSFCLYHHAGFVDRIFDRRRHQSAQLLASLSSARTAQPFLAVQAAPPANAYTYVNHIIANNANVFCFGKL